MGILLLLCGYFLSDQPDSKSVMHFDSNPSCPSVISKAIKYTIIDVASQATVSSDHNCKHKSKVPKHISFEIMLPQKHGYVFHPVNRALHTCTLPGNYAYLFYEEINPPPPKAA